MAGKADLSQLRRNPTVALLSNLTMRDVRAKYQGSVLGRLWSLVNPVATIAIFSLVFGLFFRGGVEPGTSSGIDLFAVWIACGIIPWTFTAQGIAAAMNSFTGASSLLTKVYFPRHVLPTSAVLALAVTFLIELSVLLLLVVVVGGPRVLLFLPVLVVLVALNVVFVLGVGVMLAIAVVYYRDVSHLWGIFTQLWFYATGIVFPFSMVVQAQASLDAAGHRLLGMPIPLVPLFQANPAFEFVQAYRNVLYDYTLPDLGTWLWILGWTALVTVGGVAVYRRHQARLVEEL